MHLFSSLISHLQKFGIGPACSIPFMVNVLDTFRMAENPVGVMESGVGEVRETGKGKEDDDVWGGEWNGENDVPDEEWEMDDLEHAPPPSELPRTVNPLSLLFTYDAHVARLSSMAQSLRNLRSRHGTGEDAGHCGELTDFDDQLNSILATSRTTITRLELMVNLEDAEDDEIDAPARDIRRVTCSSCSLSIDPTSTLVCCACGNGITGTDELYSSAQMEMNKEGVLCHECAKMAAFCYDGVCEACGRMVCGQEKCKRAMAVCSGCFGSPCCATCAAVKLAQCKVCSQVFCSDCEPSFLGKKEGDSYWCCSCWDDEVDDRLDDADETDDSVGRWEQNGDEDEDEEVKWEEDATSDCVDAEEDGPSDHDDVTR